MAQWDVYANPSPRSRGELPYLIDIQSDLLTGLTTRLVVPCAAAAAPQLPSRMSPGFEIGGRTVFLVPQETGAVPASALRSAVASVRNESFRIVDALDAVVSGV